MSRSIYIFTQRRGLVTIHRASAQQVDWRVPRPIDSSTILFQPKFLSHDVAYILTAGAPVCYNKLLRFVLNVQYDASTNLM